MDGDARRPSGTKNISIRASAGEIVQSLINEYRASESPDYINWGLDDAAQQPAAPPERMPGESALESY